MTNVMNDTRDIRPLTHHAVGICGRSGVKLRGSNFR